MTAWNSLYRAPARGAKTDWLWSDKPPLCRPRSVHMTKGKHHVRAPVHQIDCFEIGTTCPACSTTSRTARASATAPGVSPCSRIECTRIGIFLPV